MSRPFRSGDPWTIQASAKGHQSLKPRQHQGHVNDRIRWYQKLGVSVTVGEQIYQAGIQRERRRIRERTCATEVVATSTNTPEMGGTK